MSINDIYVACQQRHTILNSIYNFPIYTWRRIISITESNAMISRSPFYVNHTNGSSPRGQWMSRLLNEWFCSSPTTYASALREKNPTLRTLRTDNAYAVFLMLWSGTACIDVGTSMTHRYTTHLSVHACNDTSCHGGYVCHGLAYSART